MKLGDLLRKAKISRRLSGYQALNLPEGWRGLEIKGITDDSRRVKRGCLFVAVKGLEHDGHDYVEQAVENGASAVVFDVNLKFKIKNLKLTYGIGVENSRRVLGLLWAAWYGFPSRKLKVLGVTGTDGKTTTANLIYHLLQRAGRRVGLVSTLGVQIDGQIVDTGFHVTTPSPELLQEFLAKMVKKKIDFAVLEVTSHGLDQERLAGVEFNTAVVTNVTHEHLDYHGTYQNYLKTKAKLFQNVSWSILNGDDRSFRYLKKIAEGKCLSYGLKRGADVSAAEIKLTGEKSTFVLHHGRWEGVLKLNLPGFYNVANALAAYSAGRALSLPPASLVRGLASFRGLVGRFEEIKEGQPFRVIVDFAHTPNALAQVLRLSSKLHPPSSRLIVVFGCAGERDRGKRLMMGGISGELADISVLTAEDPRREDVNAIIASIAAGCRRSGAYEIPLSGVVSSKFKIQSSKLKKNLFLRVPDRRKAIESAVKIAQPGDLIIITGKGHEKSMCFGTKEYPWSDQKTVRKVLEGMNATNVLHK